MGNSSRAKIEDPEQELGLGNVDAVRVGAVGTDGLGQGVDQEVVSDDDECACVCREV